MTSLRSVKLRSVCIQDRNSIRPGQRDDLRYIGLETIESKTGLFVEGVLSKTPEVPQANSFHFTDRHVLYGKLRPYLNKVALPNFEGKCSTEIIPLLPSDELDRAYLAFFLRSAQAVSHISAKTAGARMPRADMDFVLGLELPLLPIPEQRRIVDILSRAEGIVRLRRDAQRKAAELIPGIFLDMFGDPATNPKGWAVCRLEDLIAETKLGLVRGSKEVFEDGLFPYLRMNSVGDGYVRTDNLKRVNATDKDVAEYSLHVGDFLFNTRNSKELVGKTGIFPGATEPCILFNNNLMRIRFKQEMILPEFVNAQFQTDSMQRQLESIKRGTTSVFAVYYKDLRNLILIVPTLDEQCKFSEMVQNIRSIQSQQDAATEKAEAAFAALLAQAFRPAT